VTFLLKKKIDDITTHHEVPGNLSLPSGQSSRLERQVTSDIILRRIVESLLGQFLADYITNTGWRKSLPEG
jgi:hypothetical protein